MPVTSTLRVRVPASTSNLGPGFDLLGLALSLHLDVRLAPAAGSGRHVAVHRGEDAESLSGADPDLLVAAFERAARELRVPGRFRLECESEVPAGRGFGSSGAAVAGGLLLANALAREPVDRRTLLGWGVELEGHPDNVTASLLGGCTLCHPNPDGAGPVCVQAPVHASIGVALAWPPAPLPTPVARRALPEEVAFLDAVENPRRLALLLEGLRTGDGRLLALGVEERLHVAHRLALLPGAGEALAAALAAGAWAATISGAGSGLVALGPAERAPAVAAAMEVALRERAGGGRSRVVAPVLTAPQVVCG